MCLTIIEEIIVLYLLLNRFVEGKVENLYSPHVFHHCSFGYYSLFPIPVFPPVQSRHCLCAKEGQGAASFQLRGFAMHCRTKPCLHSASGG